MRSGVVILCLALVSLVGAQKLSPEQKRRAVHDALVDNPGLKFLDLDFCGTGSESQISRGPLGCGFPSSETTRGSWRSVSPRDGARSSSAAPAPSSATSLW